jgi:hypothetical protein
MSDIIQWTNNNSGWVSVLTFLAGILLSSFLWILKRPASKPVLKLEVLKGPTLCSSFDAGVTDDGEVLHRTAFLIYGRVPVQVGDIHLGYRSSATPDGESFRWLVNETVLLQDYKDPIGENFKVYPFLKQSNSSIDNSRKTYLLPGEYENGLVYFEQEESYGLDYPYMDADSHVLTRIRVHDTLGSFWETDASVVKVKIEAIRENNPAFGLAREYDSART